MWLAGLASFALLASTDAAYTYGPAETPWYAPTAATTVHIAPRTDGQPGSGTASDPYDASSPTKYDALIQRFKSNVSIYYAAGTYYTEGWKPGKPQTANVNCYHLGAGIDQTIVRLASDSTCWVIFAGDYNQRSDGFELWNITLDGNANNNVLFQQQKNAIGLINVNGSNILLKQDKFMGFGTAIQGNECFPIFISPGSYFAGQILSHVHVSTCIFTLPATGNKDGLSACTVGPDPSWTAVDFCIYNCQFLNINSDFSYAHALCGCPSSTLNTVNGCDTGWYAEPGSWGGSNVANFSPLVDSNTFTNVRTAFRLTFHPNGQWAAPITFSNNTVTLPNASNINAVGLAVNGSFGIFPAMQTFNFIGNHFNGMSQQPSGTSYYRAIDLTGAGASGAVVGKMVIQNNHFGSYVPSGREFCIDRKEVPNVSASGNVYSNGTQVSITYSN